MHFCIPNKEVHMTTARNKISSVFSVCKFDQVGAVISCRNDVIAYQKRVQMVYYFDFMSVKYLYNLLLC